MATNNNPSGEMSSDQLAPHSSEAEEAVLGSILISPESLYEVMSFITPADFFIVRYGWIYEAMLHLQERGTPIDVITLSNELEQSLRLKEIGGTAIILSLINKTPSSLNVEGYGRIVKNMAVRRGLIDAASQIARVAHSDETDIDTVVNKSEAALFEATRGARVDRTRNSAQLASEIFDRTMRKLKPDYIDTGIQTYQASVDRIVRSFQPGDFVIVAGRPSMGKSSWLLSVLAENARNGIKGGLLTLEMSAEQVGTRLIASECKIPYRRLLDGDLNTNTNELDRFIAATDAFNNWRLPIDETGDLNPFDVRKILRRMVYEDGIEFACIDYIQLMSGGAAYHGKDNRVQEISFISRQLKQIAKELGIPILSAAQLSRAVEQRRDKRPMLSDLRESGALEQDTDYVIFLYRDNYYNPESHKGNTTEAAIAKNRHGKTGIAELVFLEEEMKFGDLLKDMPLIPPLKGMPAGRNGNGAHGHVYRGDRE